jgi:hypothetical protein
MERRKKGMVESKSNFEDEIGSGEKEESEASAPDGVIHADDEGLINNDEVMNSASEKKLSAARENRSSQHAMTGSSQNSQSRFTK